MTQRRPREYQDIMVDTFGALCRVLFFSGPQTYRLCLDITSGLPYVESERRRQVVALRNVGESEWFSVPEAAEILGIGKQSVYDAVNDGRLKAVGEGWQRRVKGQDILAYAVRTERDVQKVGERMIGLRKDVDWGTVLMWILIGLGLVALLSAFLEEKK